jgi:hypothetical protein
MRFSHLYRDDAMKLVTPLMELSSLACIVMNERRLLGGRMTEYFDETLRHRSRVLRETTWGVVVGCLTAVSLVLVAQVFRKLGPKAPELDASVDIASAMAFQGFSASFVVALTLLITAQFRGSSPTPADVAYADLFSLATYTLALLGVVVTSLSIVGSAPDRLSVASLILAAASVAVSMFAVIARLSIPEKLTDGLRTAQRTETANRLKEAMKSWAEPEFSLRVLLGEVLALSLNMAIPATCLVVLEYCRLTGADHAARFADFAPLLAYFFAYMILVQLTFRFVAFALASRELAASFAACILLLYTIGFTIVWVVSATPAIASGNVGNAVVAAGQILCVIVWPFASGAWALRETRHTFPRRLLRYSLLRRSVAAGLRKKLALVEDRPADESRRTHRWSEICDNFWGAIRVKAESTAPPSDAIDNRAESDDPVR